MTGLERVKREVCKLENQLDLELWNSVGARRPKEEVAYYYDGLEQLRLVRQKEGRKSCSIKSWPSAMSGPTPK